MAMRMYAFKMPKYLYEDIDYLARKYNKKGKAETIRFLIEKEL